MTSNLTARIAVAAIAIPAILWISSQGGIWLFGLVSLLALVATYEFLSNEGHSMAGPLFWLAIAAIVSSLLLTVTAIPFGHTNPFQSHNDSPFFFALGAVVLIFFLLTGILLALGKQTPSELFSTHARLTWGVTYLALLYPFVYALGNDATLAWKITPATGGDLLWLLYAILWVGDTAAMGIGGWLGRHQLAPGVSPRKTVEGFLGGVVGSLCAAALVYIWKFNHLQFLHIIVLALGCSVVGQLGDLVESMWKRSLGIKDSSNLIPGHGGVLDRFDSLLFAAPFMYVYIWYYL